MIRRPLATLPFLLFVLAACVGDDPKQNPPSDPDAGTGTDSGGGGTDSGAGTDSGGGGTDSGGGTDGGGGPRSINCDSMRTCTGTNKCCGVGTDWPGSTCKDNCGGSYELACDDAADCGSGQVCCSITDGGARTKQSYCKLACGTNEEQLCSLSGSECKAGTCTPYMNWAPSGVARCK